jgi:Secretion system C-terminal sorting domain
MKNLNSKLEKMNRLVFKSYLLVLLGILFNSHQVFSQDCNCEGGVKGYSINNKSRSDIPNSVFSSNSTFYITGTFTVDGYLNLTNKTLIMGPGARIVLETARVSNTNLQLINCTIKGCGCMWEGITVNKRGILTFTNNRIQDAYHAIYVNGGSIISDKAQLQNVVGNVFDNNYISIWVEKFFTITNIPWQSTPPFMVGNTFTSSGTLAKGYFADGFNDCIGIYGINAREIVQIGKSQQSLKKYPPNIFSNLAQGIYLSKCDSSLVVIENNEFRNISQSAVALFDNAEIPSQVFNNTFDNTTIGVTVETAPALVRNNSFKNIHKDSLGAGGQGIYLFNSAFEVFNNQLDNVDEGIRVGGTSKVYGNVLTDVGLGIEVSPNPKDYVAVFENSIKCLRTGLTLYNPSSALNIDIYKNDITLDNQGKNIDENGNSFVTSGLWVDGFFDQINDPEYAKASIHDNQISILNGNYGMYLNISKELLFQKNNIYTKIGDPQGTSGISLSGSHRNTFVLNDAKMDTIGIFDPENQLLGLQGLTIYESSSNAFLCNQFENYGTSVSFTGVCKNSELKNNKLGTSIFGWSYNEDAVSGPQVENGNQFVGPFSEYALSHAGNDSIVGYSLFKIAGKTSAPFWPETVFQGLAPGTIWVESTNGTNWDECKELEDGGRSAATNWSEIDRDIIENRFRPMYPAQSFDAKRSLYADIMQKGISDPQIEQFVKHLDPVIRKLYEIEQRLFGANQLQPGSEHKAQWIVERLFDLHARQSSTIADLGSELRDADRNLLFAQIDNFRAMNALPKAVNKSELNDLQQMLAALEATAPHIKSRILADEIYLSTLVNGRVATRNRYNNDLLGMMKRCTQEVGSAAFAARSLFHHLNGFLPQHSGITCDKAKTVAHHMQAELSISPNPNQGDFILNLSTPTLETCTLTIYDVMGVAQKTIQVGGGQVQIAVNASGLQSGRYVVKLNHPLFSTPASMVVMN